METFKRILIAVDDSPYSLRATEKGMQLTKALQAEAALVFVINQAQARGNPDLGILPAEALMRLKKEAQETMSQLLQMFNGYEKVYHFTPQGDPEKEILAMAENWQADLLVMGTHGRTGLKHLLLGSIAEHVLHHAHIPVMIVPSRHAH